MRRTVCSLVLLLMLAARACDGIQCYTCSSVREADCELVENPKQVTHSYCGQAPSPTTLLRDLMPDLREVFNVWPPSGPGQCLRLNVTVNDRTVIVRTCTNLGESTCPSLRGVIGSVRNTATRVDHCSVCDDELCNATSHPHHVLYLVTLLLPALVLAIGS